MPDADSSFAVPRDWTHLDDHEVEEQSVEELEDERADGSVLPVCPVRPPTNGRAGETLKGANRSHGLDITAGTVDSFRDGEAMDLHMAVDGLLACDDDPDGEE